MVAWSDLRFVSWLAFASIRTIPVAAVQYSLIKEYSGPTFFDEWDFFNDWDKLNSGDVVFVGKDNHTLAYVDPKTNRAIMKVDDISNVPIYPYAEKRNSVRIQTKTAYGIGSVFVADMYHVPYGCSVWPAWWTQGANWPDGGEIDIFEGVNLMTANQMALHTTSGCTQVNAVQSSKTVSTDCNYQANGNAGCVVTNSLPASYGEAFSKANGGVFVTEFAESGISIWFYSRKDVPKVFSSGASSIDTSTFGTPAANWPSGGCDISKFFQPQYLIYDITLCGVWAGATNVFNPSCPGVCYKDYVAGSGAKYSSAFFDVASVRVYSSGSGSGNGGSSGSSSGNSSSTGSGKGNGGTSGNSSSSTASSSSSSGNDATSGKLAWPMSTILAFLGVVWFVGMH
ncbi:glycoside hydrolase family 16 protein [Flagelloscypha sp. PMI_526]|nr:glycoside hydrolase family 16 protein [Flagelloscypha sp. PMI_526]